MYYCGWDGGGTKTEVYAIDPAGNQLASAAFGPLNVNGASREAVTETVVQCVGFMLDHEKEWGRCGFLVIGMAGVSNENAVRMLENAVRAAGYSGPMRIEGDQEIALSGAVDGPGAVLIAGTGAICFGRDAAGNRFRVGGYGYLIDDGGSGYAIGRDILAAVVRGADGRGESTPLQEMTFEKLGVSDVRGMITWLYSPETGKKEVASLAPLLLRAMDMGDAEAARIAEKAARDLAELAVTLWRKSGMKGGELALTGSVMNHYPFIRARVIELVRAVLPRVAVGSPNNTPARGAALLAMEYAETGD